MAKPKSVYRINVGDVTRKLALLSALGDAAALTAVTSFLAGFDIVIDKDVLAAQVKEYTELKKYFTPTK
jgi:hypothetical protein